jgi:hypothetical protein
MSAGRAVSGLGPLEAGEPMLGVKTIGNATLIAYDEVPILATDPWFGDEDEAFFGSWGLSHRIPAAEKTDIQRAKYMVFAWPSRPLEPPNRSSACGICRFCFLTMSVAASGTISRPKVTMFKTLPDSRWVQLSKRVRVFCVSDYIQDPCCS